MNVRDCDTYPDLRPMTHPLGAGGLSAAECGNWPPASASIVELIRTRRFDEAEAALGRGFTEPADPLQSALLMAQILLRSGRREAGLECLRGALALGRKHRQCEGVLPDAPDILAGLCAEALEEGIEPCYARHLVEQAGLPPPSPNLSNWPYPVRIFTLGQWAVVVKGQPLCFSGKAQRRPLFLLHSLLARGGKAVPVTLLRKAMSEDDTGGDSRYSRGAFDMALSRLRRLLEVPDLLQLGDGLLSLNEALCWVDAWACERLLGQVEQQPDPSCGRIVLDRALRFHEGDFLAGEDSAWAVLARERIRSRLSRVARRLGRTLEEGGRWAEAGELYERLMEFFPVDEEICLHLIRSHIKRNQFAQASGIYARCRELLAKVLGVLPNTAIKALFESAQS